APPPVGLLHRAAVAVEAAVPVAVDLVRMLLDAPGPGVFAHRDAGLAVGDGILDGLIRLLSHVLIVAEDRGAVLDDAVAELASAGPDAVLVDADFHDRVHCGFPLGAAVGCAVPGAGGYSITSRSTVHVSSSLRSGRTYA